jgi:hypothetical protein
MRCGAFPAPFQVFSMFCPDLNLRNKSQWYKDSDVPDMSLDDSQVRGRHVSSAACFFCFFWCSCVVAWAGQVFVRHQDG